MASNFSLQYHPWIKCKGHEIIGNDHQFTNLPNIKQFFLVSAIVIVERKVWRIWMLISGYKGLILQSWYWFTCATLHSCGIADQRNRRFIIFCRQFHTTFIWWRQLFRRWRNYWWGMKTKELIKMLSVSFGTLLTMSKF